ncbi:hypothetical protein N1027_04105 [Herbiconiux sp. CPCC 205763]|uniref:Uncharacterized protein n=1 Tax=Herbiconiux aconitum TaxID=2970913 RepID=A0ABT2GRA6_9MICO|nr:hypothetical protein [Herbiconiux aconitum]MCS5717316.1 hypothetical protein [Herbiconiux aconitum]
MNNEHTRLSRRFLGTLIVVVFGALGALASLVFLYPAHSEATGIVLDVTLAISLAVFVGAGIFAIVTSRRITALNRASRPRR